MKRLQKKANKGVVQLAHHGLTGRTPEHLAISADIEQDVMQFIYSYANMYGLPQPAAERGRAEDPPVYLPASKNKKSAYNIYTKTVTQYSPVHYRSFCHIWRRQAAHIKVMKPRTDVCALCDNLRDKIRVARTRRKRRNVVSRPCVRTYH